MNFAPAAAGAGIGQSAFFFARYWWTSLRSVPPVRRHFLSTRLIRPQSAGRCDIPFLQHCHGLF
jgi:hypothetical protein